jgi:hypothetical protein
MGRDRVCTDSLNTEVMAITTVTEDACPEPAANVLDDGECNMTGHCWPGNWANTSEVTGAEEIWNSYEMASVVPVGCISMCQSRFETQR